MKMFQNPLADFDAPDPFMTYDPVTGYYYALFTRHDRVEIFRSRHAGDILREGESRVKGKRKIRKFPYLPWKNLWFSLPFFVAIKTDTNFERMTPL